MERREDSTQNNQTNITAAIENLQASVDKLQTLLTTPQAQAEVQAKMAANAEQALARLQTRLASGKMAMFSPFFQNSGIPTLTNPYNTAFMHHSAALSTSKALNNASAPAMQKEVKKVLEASLNNPHRAEMEALALQTVVDISNNPYWDSALKEVANVLEDAIQNPYLTLMQSDPATFSEQAISKAAYEKQQDDIKQSDAINNLRQVEAQLEADSAVNTDSLFEIKEKYYLKNGNKRRLEDVITGEANKIREDRIQRRQQNGTSYNDSVSPVRKGIIPNYQCLNAEEELILARENNDNPEDKLKKNLVGSILPIPPILEMTTLALQGATDNIVDMVKKKKKRIEDHNYQIDCLRARGRLIERLSDNKKYNEHWNRVQAGHIPTTDELQEIGELSERAEEGMGEIRESEIRGRTERLKKELKRTTDQGGDPNLFCPPAPGSVTQFEDTRPLDKWHRLADSGLGSAIEIAGSIVYGKLGQIGSQVVKYTEDKTKQKASQKNESSWKVNSTVALERSRDIQDRLYFRETAEQTAAWVAEAMSKMEKEKINGCTNSATASPPARDAVTPSTPRIDGETHGFP